MRIDNNTGMTDMRNTESSADKTVGKGSTQDGAAKKASSGNGLTINGSQLNLGEDLVEEKRKKARSMAMELMLDAYNHDKEINDTIAESSAHAESLLAENQESRSMIKDIRKEKENTNEIYNVSEGSQEAEELEILRKGRDSMGNPQAVLTENEYARYKELYADGLSDYHSRMLQLDADEQNRRQFRRRVRKVLLAVLRPRRKETEIVCHCRAAEHQQCQRHSQQANHLFPQRHCPFHSFPDRTAGAADVFPSPVCELLFLLVTVRMTHNIVYDKCDDLSNGKYHKMTFSRRNCPSKGLS